MENSNVVKPGSKTILEVVQESHFLVHEISHDIEIGNLESAKDQLRKLDMFLHDCI